MEPRILSLVISDLKTKRLVGLKKETFEEVLRKLGIPCQYFCRRSFATWDILLPTEEQAAKFRWTNRGRFESEYKDQFHIVICTYSYYQTDICFW